jgi:hypothetical protein
MRAVGTVGTVAMEGMMGKKYNNNDDDNINQKQQQSNNTQTTRHSINTPAAA